MRFHKMKLVQCLGGLVCLLLFLYSFSSTSSTSPLVTYSTSPWTWACSPREKICIKERRMTSLANQSETSCRLQCSPENYLWPLPLQYSIEETYSYFNPNDVIKYIKTPTKEVETMFDEA